MTKLPPRSRPEPVSASLASCRSPTSTLGVSDSRPEPRSPSRTAASSTVAAAGNRCGPSIAATNPTRRRGCLPSAAAPRRKPPPGRHAASTSGDCRSGLGIRVVLAFRRGRSGVNVVGIMRRPVRPRRGEMAVQAESRRSPVRSQLLASHHHASAYDGAGSSRGACRKRTMPEGRTHGCGKKSKRYSVSG